MNASFCVFSAGLTLSTIIVDDVGSVRKLSLQHRTAEIRRVLFASDSASSEGSTWNTLHSIDSKESFARDDALGNDVSIFHII
jgi:hypothetical protein